MSVPPPQFYIGAMSPYSWFAAERIEGLLPEAEWCGVLAGALFKANERVSWGLTERRAVGIADCEARAVQHRLGPIHWPEPWPTSDLLIARAMAFLQRAQSAPPTFAPETATDVARTRVSLREFALTAMRMAFLEGVDLGERDAVLAVGGRVGIDEAELGAAIAEQSVKDYLRALTDRALGLGVFGVPTVLVDGELFWGDDRLEAAAAAHRSHASARN